MSDLKGQETARRVLEIAAAGQHKLLLVGPPSAGKSMFAARDFAGELDLEAPVDAASDISGDGRALLEKAIETQSLSARGLHRILRVTRTIANLKRSDGIERRHLAEALAYRAMPLLA